MDRIARRYHCTPAEIVGVHPRSWEGLILTVAAHRAGQAADVTLRESLKGGSMAVVNVGGPL